MARNSTVLEVKIIKKKDSSKILSKFFESIDFIDFQITYCGELLIIEEFYMYISKFLSKLQLDIKRRLFNNYFVVYYILI